MKSNPYPRRPCSDREKCALCDIRSEVNCKKRDVVYRVSCTGDHDDKRSGTYVGETSRSLGERYNEHAAKYAADDETSVFSSHMREAHGGDKLPLQVEIISTHPGDAMLRQNTEAVYIREERPALNKKDEYGNSNVPRKRRDNTDTGPRW